MLMFVIMFMLVRILKLKFKFMFVLKGLSHQFEFGQKWYGWKEQR
jgi:hypothetical protein